MIATFKDLQPGQAFEVRGIKYLKLSNRVRLAPFLYANSVRLDGGGLQHVGARVEVTPVTLN